MPARKPARERTRTRARNRPAAASALAASITLPALLTTGCGAGSSGAPPAADPADVATVRTVVAAWFTSLYEDRPLEACTATGAFGGCLQPVDDLATYFNPDDVPLTSVSVGTVHISGDQATVSTQDITVNGGPMPPKQVLTLLFTRDGALWSYDGLASPAANGAR